MDIGEDLPSLEDVDSILSPYENLLAEADPKLELSKPQPQNGERIMLGGVMIRLQSLREACESIFEESVELVTDAELIGDDKVVVVGKECGIHVMYCSREKILPPPPEEMTIDESVTVSPQSLRQALSTIHGEAIEIIPDAELLAQGIVAFTGKKIGLAVVKHPRIRVPVDSWRDTGAAFNLKSSDSNELDALRKRVDRIESRLAEMSAVVLSRVEPEAEEDANISIETISIEDLEQDELEPISDPSLDESEDDDDFMAALSGIKEGEFTIEDEDGVEDDQGDDELALSGDPDEQDLLDDLEGLDLGEELSDDEDVPGGEDQEDKLELGDFGEELNLDDLSLDEVEDELGEGKKPEISSDDDEVDEEEFDLDVLNELDLDEGEDFTPHKVFDGEKILLLGGEDEHIEDYDRIIYELGGRGEWHGSLAHMQSEEIHELVNQSDLIVMVTADSLSDSGIIQAANYARDHNKRLFEHHSSNPTSIQKQLIKIVEEGNI